MALTVAPAPAPTGLTVHQRSRELAVAFADGSAWRIPFELLRVYSPSAEVQGHSPDQAVLQTGKRDVGVDAVEPVGHYAVKIRFSDGHDTGLYTWDYLYHLGHQQDALWQAYNARLAAAGVQRDDPMPGANGRGCATA